VRGQQLGTNSRNTIAALSDKCGLLFVDRLILHDEAVRSNIFDSHVDIGDGVQGGFFLLKSHSASSFLERAESKML
jgi:hypothetical protein